MVATALPGCDPGPDARGALYDVRDSAGVRLVENRGPAWDGGDAWLVESEPEWSLGALEGPAETRFFQIRDLRVRADGVILVVDGGSAELRAFDGDGSHLWSQGGQGDGPGEYRAPATVLPYPGDSVAVYDSETRRVTVVSPGGEPVRSYRPEVPEGHTMAAPRVAVTPQRWLSSVGVSLGRDLPPSSTLAPPLPFFWSRPDGSVLDSVVSLPTSSRLVQQSGAGVGVWTVPFSVGGAVAGGGGRLVTGDPAAPRWTARDTLGRVVQVVSFPAERRPLRDEDWVRAREASIPEGAEPARREAVAEAYGAMERPADWPVFQDLLLDDRGHVWVRRFQAPGTLDEPGRWWVFTGEGRLLGQVSTPAALAVHAIVGDRIVGVATDSLGVERVRAHRIRRPRQ
jgi:hypothetical protein